MKSYIIKKVDACENQNEDIWKYISKLQIDNYTWDNRNYRPKTEAALVYTRSEIRIRFTCCEDFIKAIYLNQNDPVYKDSCVEFFFMLDTNEEEKYMNIEVNPFGTMLIQFGKSRNERIFLNPEYKIFDMVTSINKDNIASYKKDYWWVEFSIPFTFIKQYFGRQEFKSGKIIKGNLYKCGDDTNCPHYGSWNPIKNPFPDFHRIEFFGDLVFE